MNATTIVAYTFNGDIYCPACIVAALPTGEGQAFDGWAVSEGVRVTPEENLSELAYAFGIDRDDEGSFDSGDFPKVVFASQVWGDPDTPHCGQCGEPVMDD